LTLTLIVVHTLLTSLLDLLILCLVPSGESSQRHVTLQGLVLHHPVQV
jgi:hypothetical protein